jgi:penicillin-insensitive murein endopeptidase
MSVFIRVVLLGFVALIAACESKSPSATAPKPAENNQPLGSVPADAPAATLFAAARTSARGTAEVVGSYTRGCIAGATHLGGDGATWQIANPARNRAWGHPQLIAFVRELSAKVADDGHRGIMVGDLAQPRGGPMPSGHTSHQVGLDADVWLHPMPARKLTERELNAYNGPSLVDFSAMRVTSGFGDAQYSMLMHAAQSPRVERIFISPPIKREMCNRAPAGDRAWLRKLRPWTGHAAHMHVRLACPIDSDDCKAQDEPPEGDGCGAELQSWFDDRSWMRPSTDTYVPREPMKLDALPAACRRVLSAQG